MKYILFLELHGIQVSRPFKINYNKDINLYLYPKELFKTFSDINEIIEDLESSTSNIYTFLMPTFLKFEIGNGRFSYLVSEISIDIYQDERSFFQDIYRTFDLFLRINSFIFGFFINIQKIFVFSKQEYGYRLNRIIDHRIIIDRNKAGVMYYRLDNYSEDISLLFNRVRNSELLQDLVQLFYEFIASQNSSEIETKIIYLWNYLEHIANIYTSHINKNLLIDQNKYQQLQERISGLVTENLNTSILVPIHLAQLNSKIRGLLNRIKQEKSIPIEKSQWRVIKGKIEDEIIDLIKDEENDILIEGYDKKKICDLIIQKIENFPPIKELIYLMLRDIRYELSNYENRLIEYIKEARNYLFHRSIKLGGLYQLLIDRFSEITQFNFNDLKRIVKKFEEFLTRVTAEIFHSKILKGKRTRGKATINWFHPGLEEAKSGKEYFIEKLNSIRETFSQTKRHKNLIKFILRKEKKYDGVLQNISMMGYCFGQEHRQYIKFNLEFINKFKAQGKFSGNISYPQIYDFYIDLTQNFKELVAIMKFRQMIYLSNFSNTHSVYIDFLDFWFDIDDFFRKNEELRNILQNINT